MSAERKVGMAPELGAPYGNPQQVPGDPYEFLAKSYTTDQILEAANTMRGFLPFKIEGLALPAFFYIGEKL